MVNLPFKVHFGGAHFIYAGGFFLWWFSLFLVWPLWPRYRVTNYRARFQVYGFLPSAHYYRECLCRQLAPYVAALDLPVWCRLALLQL